MKPRATHGALNRVSHVSHPRSTSTAREGRTRIRMDARDEKQKKNKRARKTKVREKEIEEERKMRESLKGLARGITAPLWPGQRGPEEKPDCWEL